MSFSLCCTPPFVRPIHNTMQGCRAVFVRKTHSIVWLYNEETKSFIINQFDQETSYNTPARWCVSQCTTVLYLMWTESRVLNPIAILVLDKVGDGYVHGASRISCSVSHSITRPTCTRMTSVLFMRSSKRASYSSTADFAMMTLHRSYKERLV